MGLRSTARGLCSALALSAAVLPHTAPAQTAQAPNGQGARPMVVQSPLLTLDQDRLFRSSAFGRRVLADLERATSALAEENRRIEEQLVAEEKRLTEQRQRVTPEVFRRRADAFDEKVVAIRRAQDAKERRLGQVLDEERQLFFERSVPILGEIVRESGAMAILDSRAIVLSSNAIDITDRAIARVNAQLGDGRGLREEAESAAPTAPGEAPQSDPGATQPTEEPDVAPVTPQADPEGSAR
jgi:Skp family chaperone for outer membrane proteins